MRVKAHKSPPEDFKVIELQPIPSNELTRITGSFIEKIEVTDPRFSLVWSFGTLLQAIPQRLGTHRALDAAAIALTNTFPYLTTRTRTPDMLKAHGDALTSLRGCLSSPAEALNTNTLCAIYLIWIYEVSPCAVTCCITRI